MTLPPRVRLNLVPGRIGGTWLLQPEPIEDNRGFFVETYREALVSEALGRPYRFVQTNHSRSRAGTLRGFRSEPWDKLIYIPHGTALCVVVDPRRDSPTFGQHETFLLGDVPGRRDRLLVSRGLCNAFYCLTEADYLNDVSAEFEPTVRRGFRWDDPTLAIDWPDRSPSLSDHDATLPSFADYLAGR
ncbi:MAG: dTDP-4-dehydrorhamnose 3,5-epimerase family protein [Rhodobacteraceae bacterium]|nr:dTDP-4-dehydrorhamnose 3,5-epimerase family protein [Paracoccaceae bacterium]